MKERHIAILLLFFLVVYNAQGVLYAKGSSISQMVLISIHGIGCLYFIKTLLLKTKKNLFYKAWTALLLLNIFGLIFTGSLTNSIHFSMFKGVLMSLLVFYPFYYFSYKGLLSYKDLIILVIVLIPIYIGQFYLAQEQILSERVSVNTNVVNNTAYDILWLLPFVFFIKKNKVVSASLFLITIFFIIQSAKRGAMLIAGVTLLFYAYYQLKTISEKNRVRGYFITFLGIVAVGYYAINFFIQNEYLIERLQQLEEGSYSGRDVIYANLFNAWYSSDNFFNLLFGYGFASSVNLSGTGNLAHNDWLELLTNFGLLGVIIYMMLFFSGFKNVFSTKWGKDKRIIMGVIMTMWLLSTIFSMGYTVDGGYLKAILLAYLIGDNSNLIKHNK